MKTLYVVRHAKSSWETGLADHDRPLNPRGLRDAPKLASLLNSQGVKPDLLISSTAKRARETAEYFISELEIAADIQWESTELYLASLLEIFNVLAVIPEEYNTVMIFGHNPGLTHFVNEFWGTDWLDNLPTCGIVKITGDISEWLDFTGETAQVVAHFFPKEIS